MKKYIALLIVSEMKNQQNISNETVYRSVFELFQPQHQTHMLIFEKLLSLQRQDVQYIAKLLAILIYRLLGSNVLSILCSNMIVR